jgi:hypothetical protein
MWLLVIVEASDGQTSHFECMVCETPYAIAADVTSLGEERRPKTTARDLVWLTDAGGLSLGL